MSVLTEGQHAGEFIVSEANKTRSREAVTVLSGQNLTAGAVIGKILLGVGKADIPAVVGTGNGTMSDLFAGPDVQSGSYVVACTEAATHGGTFSVVTPSGDALPDLTLTVGAGTATDYISSHINFTVTDGATDFAVGDSFTITVGSGNPTVVGTGDGAMSAVSVGPRASPGTYVITCTEAVTNGGAFSVVTPAGSVLPDFVLAASTAYTSSHINFTITDGVTDFAVGDNFKISVWNAPGKVVEWTPGTYDGRHLAAGVLFDAVDASLADTDGVIIARDAEVNWAELQWASAIAAAEKDIALKHLDRLGIISR